MRGRQTVKTRLFSKGLEGMKSTENKIHVQNSKSPLKSKCGTKQPEAVTIFNEVCSLKMQNYRVIP